MPQLMFSLYKNNYIFCRFSAKRTVSLQEGAHPFWAPCPTVFNQLKYTKKILKESFLIPLTNTFWLKNHIGAIISYYLKLKYFQCINKFFSQKLKYVERKVTLETNLLILKKTNIERGFKIYRDPPISC